MKDRLVELINSFDELDFAVPPDWWIKHFADHLIANGVIVPPVKVGQTVYMLSRGKIIPMIVNSISFNGDCEYMLNCNYEDEETHGYSLLTFTEKTKGYYWELTKEEAEKALAERNNQ